MAKLKDTFNGTGSMKKFADETNKLFSAINNISFIMPSGYGGVEPTVELKDGKLVFDFGNMLIFTLDNVSWKFTGSASINSNKVQVVNGQLVISVDAD